MEGELPSNVRVSKPFLATQRVGWNENAYRDSIMELRGPKGIYEELRALYSFRRRRVARQASPSAAGGELRTHRAPLRG